MKVDLCLPNIRCNGRTCHNLAQVSIDTDGFKGCIYLCNDCFNNLSKEIKNYSKKINKTNGEK